MSNASDKAKNLIKKQLKKKIINKNSFLITIGLQTQFTQENKNTKII